MNFKNKQSHDTKTIRRKQSNENILSLLLPKLEYSVLIYSLGISTYCCDHYLSRDVIYKFCNLRRDFPNILFLLGIFKKFYFKVSLFNFFLYLCVNVCHIFTDNSTVVSKISRFN